MIEAGGLIFAFIIGLACRRLDIPAPAPPRIEGALLVVAMTAGFILTDLAMAS
jgi:XapX domain-containing protein